MSRFIIYAGFSFQNCTHSYVLGTSNYLLIAIIILATVVYWCKFNITASDCAK